MTKTYIGLELSRENLIKNGDLFDMQAPPFEAISKDYGFTGDMVMIAPAYYEFLAISDMPAHIGIRATDRWETVLDAVVAEFAKLPKGKIISELSVMVKVLDPDGQYRDKLIIVAAGPNERKDHTLTFTLPRPKQL